MHLGVVLGDLAALQPGPDHEGVHGPLDVVLRSLFGQGLQRTHAAAEPILAHSAGRPATQNPSIVGCSIQYLHAGR